MEAKLTPWIVLFIAAAAQGAFLSVMLFFKKNRKKKAGQSLLAALILAFTITIAYYTTFWTGINPRLSLYLIVILQFTFLFGPLSWLYLHVTLRKKWPKLAILHFLPFVLICVLFLFGSRIFTGLRLPGYFFSVAQTTHLLIYAFLNLWLTKQTGNNPWAKSVALSFLGYVLCFTAYHVLNWTGLLKTEYDYMVSLGMTVFIYYIGYHGFRTPVIDDLSPEVKYQKSSLTDNSIEYIAQKLDTMMMHEKLFTKGDLKLQEAAEKLDVSVHALSQAINVAKNKKFTDYLNEYRVKEAIRLMQLEEYEQEKLMAVGIDSGFNNKTSFLNAFKKYVGQSPSEYRKALAQEAKEESPQPEA
jgi:AraC-like DNA-binding protein